MKDTRSSYAHTFIVAGFFGSFKTKVFLSFSFQTIPVKASEVERPVSPTELYKIFFRFVFM